MKDINWGKIITALVLLGILALFSGVFQLQSVKAKVETVEADVVALQDRDVVMSNTIKAMGIILCGYAIKDNMENAKEICKDVLAN